MAPHFKLPGEKKKKKPAEPGFTWFETTVNGGVVVLSLLRDAATLAPVPYLRGAAVSTLTLIQIAQTVKDNRADFRRLCADAAALTVVVYDSRQRSEDPDGWPGPGLKDSVDNFLSLLASIEAFARSQVDRTRFIRVMNSIGDGNKIKEFRENLAQAMNRFEVTAHLQSYEILRLIKNMMEDYKNRLDGQIAKDESNRPLPEVPSDTESEAEQMLRDEELAKSLANATLEEKTEEQLLRDEELAKSLAAEEKRKAEERATEQEARKKEQEAVNEKLQQILRMLEKVPEPGESSKAKSERENSSSDEESIVKMAMKNAADKRADRESRRKDLDSILSRNPAGTAHNPYSDIASLRAGAKMLKVTSKNSGNVNSSTVYGSHNDNSTVTRISKGPPFS